MAIGAPNVGTNTERAAEASTAVPYPATVNAGDFMVMMGSMKTATNPSVTNPAGWTQQANFGATGSTTIPGIYVGTQIAAGTEGGTSVTVTHTSVVSAWQIIGFPGVDRTNPLDIPVATVDQAVATATTIATQTVATDQAAGYFAATQNATAANATPPTGFTETADRVSGTNVYEVAYKLGFPTGATGAIANSWGASSAKSVGVLLMLRPAGIPDVNMAPMTGA